MPTVFTNHYNLPEPLVDAIKFNDHLPLPGISITQLIDAPQIRILKKKHTVEEDVIDRIWALFGSSIHSVVERAHLEKEKERYLIEQNLSVNIDDWQINSRIDMYDKKEEILYDFKVTSVWSIVFGNDKWQWDAQMNCYKYILKQNEFNVKQAKIICILRDWKQSEQLKYAQDGKSNYPEKQVQTVDIKLLDDKTMEDYLRKRVDLHKQAELGNIPDCRPKDMWQKEATFAVMKEKQTRAMRVFDNTKEAEDYIKNNSDKINGLHLQVRPGENVRCERFCPVREVCPQRMKNK